MTNEYYLNTNLILESKLRIVSLLDKIHKLPIKNKTVFWCGKVGNTTSNYVFYLHVDKAYLTYLDCDYFTNKDMILEDMSDSYFDNEVIIVVFIRYDPYFKFFKKLNVVTLVDAYIERYLDVIEFGDSLNLLKS